MGKAGGVVPLLFYTLRQGNSTFRALFHAGPAIDTGIWINFGRRINGDCFNRAHLSACFTRITFCLIHNCCHYSFLLSTVNLNQHLRYSILFVNNNSANNILIPYLLWGVVCSLFSSPFSSVFTSFFSTLVAISVLINSGSIREYS